MGNLLDYFGSLTMVVLAIPFAFLWQATVFPVRMLSLIALAAFIYWLVSRKFVKSRVGRHRCGALVLTLILLQNPFPLLTTANCSGEPYPCDGRPQYSAFSDLIFLLLNGPGRFGKGPHQAEIFALLILLLSTYFIIFLILNLAEKISIKGREKR